MEWLCNYNGWKWISGSEKPSHLLYFVPPMPKHLEIGRASCRERVFALV